MEANNQSPTAVQTCPNQPKWTPKQDCQGTKKESVIL